jgi:uncharacterized membrane protein HdeD (DUF308 family)
MTDKPTSGTTPPMKPQPSADLPQDSMRVKNEQPGLIAGVCSIVAGVTGFSVPVVGMIASCVGIWLGVSGFRRGRSASYRPSIICGIIGALVSILGIAYWVSAVLFESYR